jgi:hypothetical protein
MVVSARTHLLPTHLVQQNLYVKTPPSLPWCITQAIGEWSMSSVLDRCPFNSDAPHDTANTANLSLLVEPIWLVKLTTNGLGSHLSVPGRGLRLSGQ